MSGTWTARLGDAGTWQIQVPNKAASDGVQWLGRFTAKGRSDWIEIKRDGFLEFCGCVETVKPDYQSVTISGHDAFWQLKSCYERDWQCLQAPRDVMEHASRVGVPVLVDSFLDSSLGAQWTSDGSTISLSPNSGLTMSDAGGGLPFIDSVAHVPYPGAKWSVSVPISSLTSPGSRATSRSASALPTCSRSKAGQLLPACRHTSPVSEDSPGQSRRCHQRRSRRRIRWSRTAGGCAATSTVS